MKKYLGILLPALLVSALIPAATHAQNGPALTAKKRVEVAADGRTFRVVSTSVFFRDAVGRTREEVTHYAKDGRIVRQVIHIIDVGNGLAYELNPVTRTGVRRELPIVGAATSPPTGPKVTLVKAFQTLGTRKIESWDCTGQRYGPAPVAKFYDVWRCDGIKLDLERTYHKVNGQIERETFSGVQMGEPDASLFVPPEGYQITVQRAG